MRPDARRRAGRANLAGVASIAFVLPFGEPEEAFFADTLLCLLAADARRLGHDAHVLRVYYDGRDQDRDRSIRARLREWLGERDAALIVVERLFDPEPVLAHAQARPGRSVLQVTRGDSVEPAFGIDHVLGAVTASVPGSSARRTPSIASLRHAFGALLEVFERGDDLSSVPGVAHLEQGELIARAPLDDTNDEGPFDPVLDHDVIAPGAPPTIWQKTLLGNIGCPFADDPMNNPHYAGVSLPAALPVARLGCAFCHMGGDYEKRADGEVVSRLVEQAAYFAEKLPAIHAYTLSDQHAHRYLAALVRAAAERGLQGRRWLFPARPDAFVRERARLEEAARAAADVGHVVEVYLSGFEAFSDRELLRYNKGCTKAQLLGAVDTMRSLGRDWPESFEYARARAHSMILWNPWTSLEDVRESVTAIREHELGELFHEVSRNRLRLYRELPIYWAALRDGAVLDAWQDGDEGAARRKGYSSELPWRFLDARTQHAHALTAELGERLGRETELEQLSAALDFAECGGTALPTLGLDELEAALALLLDKTRSSALPARGSQQRAVVLRLGAGTRAVELAPALDGARATGQPLFVVGRDVTSHRLFADTTRRARESAVPLGFLLASDVDPNRTGAELPRGSRVSLRVGPAPSETVRHLVDALRSADAVLELRVRPFAGVELTDWALFAKSVGLSQLRVELSLADLGLAHLEEGAAGIRRLADECHRLGLALEVAPLRAGLGDFRFVPTATHTVGPP